MLSPSVSPSSESRITVLSIILSARYAASSNHGTGARPRFAMGSGQSTTSVSPETMYTATAAGAVAAARATALTLSPTSQVRGKTFDRFVQIFLENQDFDIAAGDRE